MKNETIERQLAHRSIRKFTTETVSPEIIATLVEVAQHTATSSFLQQYSIVGLTDPEKKAVLADICHQPYVASASHVFMMVVDLERNQQIAVEKAVEPERIPYASTFMSGYADAILAAQNIVTAAESLDLGTVFLGSILNDAPRVIELLGLPKYTFPVLGIGIGYPDQKPQLKPRLPKALVYHENQYQVNKELTKALEDYDREVTEYYDLRDANKRIDSFSEQAKRSMEKHAVANPRDFLLDQLAAQGLFKK